MLRSISGLSDHPRQRVRRFPPGSSGASEAKPRTHSRRCAKSGKDGIGRVQGQSRLHESPFELVSEMWHVCQFSYQASVQYLEDYKESICASMIARGSGQNAKAE